MGGGPEIVAPPAPTTHPASQVTVAQDEFFFKCLQCGRTIACEAKHKRVVCYASARELHNRHHTGKHTAMARLAASTNNFGVEITI